MKKFILINLLCRLYVFTTLVLLPYISMCETVKWSIPFSNEFGILLVNVRINDTVDAVLQVDNGCDEVQLNQDFIDKYAHILGFKEYPISFSSLWTYESSHIAECNIYFSFGDSIIQNTNTSGGAIIDEKTKETHKIVQFVGVYNHKNSLDIFGKKTENNASNILNIKDDGVFPLRLLAEKGIIKINNIKNCIEFVDKIDSLSVVYPFEWNLKKQLVKYPISFTDDVGKVRKYTFSTLFDLGYNGALTLFNNNRTKLLWQYLEQKNGKADRISLENAKLGKDNITYNMCDVAKVNKFINFDLIAGVGILSNYDIYFDYKKQIIALKHLATKAKPTIGFRIDVSNKGHIYTISFVDRENAKFDLLVGDIIYKIGETIVHENRFPSEMKSLANDTSNTTMTVKRKDEYVVLSRKQKE